MIHFRIFDQHDPAVDLDGDRFSTYEVSQVNHAMQILLAHLSQRLIGELIGYPWSGVRRQSSIHNFKRLLL